ncbi:MAG: PIN domain-containing protein [Lacunisphaera sp.]|nr:PIN domain-containing protein [Lacunisphaera sp.]
MPALLDTGVLELLRRRDLRVESLVLKHYPPVLCPHVTGEYLHCQLKARVSPTAALQARTYVAAFEVLTVSSRTAEVYADLCHALTTRDITLAPAVCWIAAHALEHDLPLLTTDRSFRQVPGLQVRVLHPRFTRVAGT